MATRIEEILIDDGRRAERHTTIADDGTQTIEVYCREQPPLILQSRVVTSNSFRRSEPAKLASVSRPEPLFKPQAVEKNAEPKKRKSDELTNYGLVAMIVLQIAAMLAALLLL